MEDVPTILSIIMVLLLIIVMALYFIEKRLKEIRDKNPQTNIRHEGAMNNIAMITDTLREMDRRLAQLVRKEL